MTTMIVIIVVVIIVLVGTVLSLLSSARTGMPSQDVLERARRRAQQLDAEEKDPDS